MVHVQGQSESNGMKLWVARAESSLFDPGSNAKRAAFCWHFAAFVPAGRADLARVVLAAAALPKEHQARVFGAFGVSRGHRMPMPTVRAAPGGNVEWCGWRL